MEVKERIVRIYSGDIFLVTGSSLAGWEMVFVRKGKECRQSAGGGGGVSQTGEYNHLAFS